MIRKLHCMTWLILLTYITGIVLLQVEFFSIRAFIRPIIEQLLISLPLLILVLYLSHQSDRTIGEKSSYLQSKREFIGLLTCFFLGTVIEVIMDYNNSDLKAWWPLALYVMFFYGVLYSLIYTFILYLGSFHNKYYHYIFSSITVTALAFLPYIYKLSNTDPLYLMLIILLISHFLVVVIYKTIKKISA